MMRFKVYTIKYELRDACPKWVPPGAMFELVFPSGYAFKGRAYRAGIAEHLFGVRLDTNFSPVSIDPMLVNVRLVKLTPVPNALRSF